MRLIAFAAIVGLIGQSLAVEIPVGDGFWESSGQGPRAVVEHLEDDPGHPDAFHPFKPQDSAHPGHGQHLPRHDAYGYYDYHPGHQGLHPNYYPYNQYPYGHGFYPYYQPYVSPKPYFTYPKYSYGSYYQYYPGHQYQYGYPAYGYGGYPGYHPYQHHTYKQYNPYTYQPYQYSAGSYWNPYNYAYHHLHHASDKTEKL